jgi:hypothetical protein
MILSETITPEMAQEELDAILAEGDVLGLRSFMRGNFCLRVLGCPCNDLGRFRVIESQDGDFTEQMWVFYAGVRAILRERYDNWLEMEEF